DYFCQLFDSSVVFF
nr:immunoglobulin light chain junction region [Macaca mulatta]MOV65850.1 immunoglobulin light chain junction region [Macaca mulatta]MOV65984.1 immunoglobulin light chain junction region [Macaca mulatta]MOV66050.1 immunoglobulin light chain junction region [Macaca mulatta]MOV66097.1 immunoglobulin light chain junction region [Macaca mulatta]